MSQSDPPAHQHGAPATHDDIRDVLGNLDDGKMVAILALRPTIRELEEASLWLSGDMDVFGPGRPLKGVPSQIVTLLTADEEDGARGAR